MKRIFLISQVLMLIQTGMAQSSYTITDTGQTQYYSNNIAIDMPQQGQDFYGQDACFQEHSPHYKDNGDGTVSDLVTGLMWEKDMGEKITFEQAKKKAAELRTGGYDDWRIPTVKELYSLMEFTGQSMGEHSVTPYIDTEYFNQPTGDRSKGEREIDAQTWTCTVCKGGTMDGQATLFGVNFIDGRIKGYPLMKRGKENRMYFRMVRGNSGYGKNRLVDNGDGTVSDLASGLMWQKADNGKLYDWHDALTYADTLTLAGYSDWRLPDAKQLQSIVDYSHSPSYDGSPAISPLFECTQHLLYEGITDCAYYWTSTTHLDGPNPYERAVYVCFGHAWGRNPRTGDICDVHGAGSQRSDPKSGPQSSYPRFFGPQQDMQCVYNAVRCVRKINTK